MRKPLMLSVIAAGALILAACGDDDDSTSAETTVATEAPAEAPAGTEAMAEEADIVDTAVAAGSFNTLAAALEAAGLVETLKGEGPYTVFAPTDEAFAAVGQETIDALLANEEALTAVLTYHVVSGEVTSDMIEPGAVATVQGGEVELATEGGVTVNDANVTAADVQASNGVIHVIDAVLIPPDVDVASL
jgi:uncharacterized surface protein with fasciclin (FAS1) repeats